MRRAAAIIALAALVALPSGAGRLLLGGGGAPAGDTAAACEATPTVSETFGTNPFTGGRWTSFTPPGDGTTNCPISYDAANGWIERNRTSGIASCDGTAGYATSVADMGRDHCQRFQIAAFNSGLIGTAGFEIGSVLWDSPGSSGGAFYPTRCEPGTTTCNPFVLGHPGFAIGSCSTLGTFAVGDYIGHCTETISPTVDRVYVFNLGAGTPPHPVDVNGSGWGPPDCTFTASGSNKDPIGDLFGINFSADAPIINAELSIDNYTAYQCGLPQCSPPHTIPCEI